MNCTGDYVVPGTLDAFFTGVGVLVTGLFAGFVAVATLVYSPPKKAPKPPYEQKYYEEFCDLEERDLDDGELTKLKDTFVCETTPHGDVIICYDKERESFEVWHDDRNIPFLVLDAVAQHYSIEQDAKKICVNYKEEFDKAVEMLNKSKEEKEEEKEKEDEKSDDVFANFKGYNKASDKSKTQENKIVPEKCNRFRRVGSIKDWHDVHDKEEEEAETSKTPKQFSYEEFKAMQKKSVEGDVVHSDSEDKKEE